MRFDIVSIMNYVVFALGFKVSSVYISKNCSAVARYERPFVSCLLINQDALVGCKPLPTRSPREGRRDLAGWGLCAPSFPHSHCQAVCHWISLLKTWHDVLPVWLRQSPHWPSGMRAPAPQHSGRRVRKPYGTVLAGDVPPGFFTWCLPVPQLT